MMDNKKFKNLTGTNNSSYHTQLNKGTNKNIDKNNKNRTSNTPFTTGSQKKPNTDRNNQIHSHNYPPPNEQTERSSSLIVASHNVNGMSEPTKQQLIYN